MSFTVFPKALVMGFILFAGLVSLGFAQSDLQTLGPNSPQRALFQKTLTELQECGAAGGRGRCGQESFAEPVTFSFDCAQGDPVARVSVSVTTTLKAWDPRGHRSAGVGGGGRVRSRGLICGTAPLAPAGAHRRVRKRWTFPTRSFSTPGALAEPQGPLDELFNQTLLYHELLHGQLLLDAMKKDDWRESACKESSPDLSAADANHERIPGLEQRLAQTLAARAPNVFALNVPPQGASRQGEFSVTLGSAAQLLGDSRSFSVSFLFDTGSNIQRGETEVALDGGKSRRQRKPRQPRACWLCAFGT